MIPLFLLFPAAGTALFMIWWERFSPAIPLPRVSGWPMRALLANLSQLALVVAVGLAWNAWLRGPSLFSAARWPLAGALGFTYLLSTFVFYWWHRFRHESTFWWRVAHQIHHSASRLEILTTFYKHPLEIGIDSILGAFLVYAVMGCSTAQGAMYTVLVALGEMFYHWNVHTPRWVGVFFQRPESHRLHHRRDRHTRNYSELPIWDFLFGTYSNPKNGDRIVCGFGGERETRIGSMLLARPVDLKRDSEAIDFRPACFGCRHRRLCRLSLAGK
jgi:sterol desaturase/sphingolipid hydroxylase (fatty acid hydroxylase superfamily)